MVDAKHYKVEFENVARVLAHQIRPTRKVVMHRHPNAVAIFVTDANGKLRFRNGKTQDFTPRQVRRCGAGRFICREQSDQPLNLIW